MGYFTRGKSFSTAKEKNKEAKTPIQPIICVGTTPTNSNLNTKASPKSTNRKTNLLCIQDEYKYNVQIRKTGILKLGYYGHAKLRLSKEKNVIEIKKMNKAGEIKNENIFLKKLSDLVQVKKLDAIPHGIELTFISCATTNSSQDSKVIEKESFIFKVNNYAIQLELLQRIQRWRIELLSIGDNKIHQLHEMPLSTTFNHNNIDIYEVSSQKISSKRDLRSKDKANVDNVNLVHLTLGKQDIYELDFI
eukprot:Pgem_evm2s17216